MFVNPRGLVLLASWFRWGPAAPGSPGEPGDLEVAGPDRAKAEPRTWRAKAEPKTWRAKAEP